jgi:hypothetical protein
MAQNIVKISDMSGVYAVEDGTPAFFDAISLETQKRILRGDGGYFRFGLLGDAEYIKLLADLTDGVPSTQKYIDLINGKNYVNTSGKNVIFQGIKEMLKGFVYFDYMDINQNSPSPMGQVDQQVENSTKASNYQNINGFRHNMGVDIYNNEAYDYINFNKSLFPDWDFSSIGKKFTNGLTG